MPRLVIVMLAFVAGWVDAGSFVGLDHVMAAHITGNLVILAGAIATGFHDTDLLKIAILPVFFVAVMLMTVVHDRFIALHDDPARHIRGLRVIESGLILAFGTGCVLGALATVNFGNGSFLVPAFLVVASAPFARQTSGT